VPNKAIKPLLSPEIDNQHRTPTVAYQFQGTDCPVIFKVVLQFVFVFEAIDAFRRRMLAGGEGRRESVPVATNFVPGDPAKNAFTVPPQYLEGPIFLHCAYLLEKQSSLVGFIFWHRLRSASARLNTENH
jgi:hypothetical protein